MKRHRGKSVSRHGVGERRPAAQGGPRRYSSSRGARPALRNASVNAIRTRALSRRRIADDGHVTCGCLDFGLARSSCHGLARDGGFRELFFGLVDPATTGRSVFRMGSPGQAFAFAPTRIAKTPIVLGASVRAVRRKRRLLHGPPPTRMTSPRSGPAALLASRRPGFCRRARCSRVASGSASPR